MKRILLGVVALAVAIVAVRLATTHKSHTYGATASAWSNDQGTNASSYTVGGAATGVAITPNSLTWAKGVTTPTVSQAQQANASVPQPMAFACQVPGAGATNATNGTPGGYTFTLPVPVNGGSEAYLAAKRSSGASSYVGSFPGLATAAGLWLGLQGATAPSSSNWAVVTDGPDGQQLYSVAQSGGGNAAHVFYINNFATSVLSFGLSPSNGQGTDLTGGGFNFGGGVKVVAIENATTEPTANVATTSEVWSFTDCALKVRSASGVITCMASLGTGTVNSQTDKDWVNVGNVRTVSTATATTLYTWGTTSTTSGRINAAVVCRAVTAPTAGAIGDTWSTDAVASYRNVAGTVTVVGTSLFTNTLTDTSMSTTVASFTVSTTNVLLQVANVASATIDCEARFKVLVN
jgi:hypothetical protein